MIRTGKLAALAVLVLGLAISVPALADRGRGHYRPRSHVHWGVFVGVPSLWYYPRAYYYPPSYYYYPPVYAAPASPPVYIERGDTGAAPEQAQAYWYYCPESQAYYPYVKQCAGGWQKVVPQPPGG
ncbi:MAG: hypothetical protein HYY78_07210 [Betaproteobacteria bacterium]|nr:hypothetical protein [Betaproteobacteria bacterium]